MHEPTIDDLELELRRIHGVVAASIQDDGVLHVQLHVQGEHTDPGLSELATRTAMRFTTNPVAVEVNHWRDLATRGGSATTTASEAAGPIGSGHVQVAGSTPRARPDLVEFEPRVPFMASGREFVDEPTPPPADEDFFESTEASTATTESADTVDSIETVETAEVTEFTDITPLETPAPTVPEFVVEPAPAAHDIIDVVAAEAAERDQFVAREPRVRLLAVLTFPDTDELEVHLTFNGQRSIGRAPASKGVLGATEATLEALKVFVPELEQAAAWAKPMEHRDTTNQYLVATELHDEDERTLHGLATGSSPIEAAARSTLHALNRTVAPTLAASLN